MMRIHLLLLRLSRLLLLFASAFLLACGSSGSGGSGGEDDVVQPIVEMTTSLGVITLRLDTKNAPITTANFLEYANAGFYDGKDGLGATIFHRVDDGFVIQGGGLDATLAQKATNAPIQNESNNGLSNLRGTIAMARTLDANSATSQFFINTVDNVGLDHDGNFRSGYAVFGEVIAGMNVVDTISGTPTNINEVPITTITITDVTVK
jgi:peptidyl-prolyl cis-trans isomerase B (cyclophilin B)